MSSQGGRRQAQAKAPLPIPGLVAHLAGILAAGAAWAFLVRAAIDFGTSAKQGGTLGWVFTGFASLGAVTCLALALLLLGRMLVSLGVIREYRPQRVKKG